MVWRAQQNANKYRIAALGAVKPLALIYNECGHTLLRRNAQVVLSNMALLAENGQVRASCTPKLRALHDTHAWHTQGPGPAP